MSNIAKLDLYEQFWDDAEKASMPSLSIDELKALKEANLPHSANPIIANIQILKWQAAKKIKNAEEKIDKFLGDDKLSNLEEKIEVLIKIAKRYKSSYEELQTQITK